MTHKVELGLAQFSLLYFLPLCMSMNVIDWMHWNAKTGRKNCMSMDEWHEVRFCSWDLNVQGQTHATAIAGNLYGLFLIVVTSKRSVRVKSHIPYPCNFGIGFWTVRPLRCSNCQALTSKDSLQFAALQIDVEIPFCGKWCAFEDTPSREYVCVWHTNSKRSSDMNYHRAWVWVCQIIKTT